MNERDLLTIKEFAERTGIKESTLRHYDTIKLFQPILRGENGYRYYSAQQTIAINLIHVLSNLNVPLKTISEMQIERTPERMLELLHSHQLELNRELFRLQQAYAVIHTYCELIQKGLTVHDLSINKQWMGAMHIQLGPMNDFSSGNFYDSFYNYLKQLDNGRLSTAYPVGGYYNSADAFFNAPGEPTNFFSILPAGRNTKEAGDYLVGYTRNYYGNLGDFPGYMRNYAQEHKLFLSGPVYEIYLHDEISLTDPDRYLVQVSMSLAKRGG